MPRIIAAFRARYPGVELKLQIANSQIIEERVKERELDLGVVGGHTVGRGEECLAAGLLDELVLVVPSGHRWAKKRDIAADQLAKEPMLMREPGSATRTVTERALQRAGVKFQAAMELDHTRSEEHTSELQSLAYLVCRLLLEKKKKTNSTTTQHPNPQSANYHYSLTCTNPTQHLYTPHSRSVSPYSPSLASNTRPPT